MTTQDIKDTVIKSLKRVSGSRTPKILGGQSCGMFDPGFCIESEELCIKIEVAFHKSALKNHELAHTLMLLAIDELIG